MPSLAMSRPFRPSTDDIFHPLCLLPIHPSHINWLEMKAICKEMRAIWHRDGTTGWILHDVLLLLRLPPESEFRLC